MPLTTNQEIAGSNPAEFTKALKTYVFKAFFIPPQEIELIPK